MDNLENKVFELQQELKKKSKIIKKLSKRKIPITDDGFKLLKEIAENEHCVNNHLVCEDCPLRYISNIKNSCQKNARILLELAEVDELFHVQHSEGK